MGIEVISTSPGHYATETFEQAGLVEQWTCDRDVYVAEDGKTVVPEGSVEAAFRFAVPNQQIPRHVAEEMGLVGPKEPSPGPDPVGELPEKQRAQPGNPEAEVETEPEPEEAKVEEQKQRPAGGDKKRKPSKNKGAKPQSEKAPPQAPRRAPASGGPAPGGEPDPPAVA